jgi:hypothetical protein
MENFAHQAFELCPEIYYLRAYHTPQTLTSNSVNPKPITVPRVILSNCERVESVWLEAPVFEFWVDVGFAAACVLEIS